MTPFLAGISNGENNQCGETPTIHEIMASQTQPREFNSSMARLPAGMHLYEMAEHPSMQTLLVQASIVWSYLEPRRIGGKQKIVTNDTNVFKLKYKYGLSYLSLEYPSDQDLEELPHVNFCSPENGNLMKRMTIMKMRF
eukprot:1657549-Ditylum_brightwellii.AAC.1